MIDIKVMNGEIEEQEKLAYMKRGIEKYGEENLIGIDIELDGEYVNLSYHFLYLKVSKVKKSINTFQKYFIFFQLKN